MGRTRTARSAIAALLATMAIAVGAIDPPRTAAQPACVAESEPNQPEVEATPIRGASCITGTLPGDDQDFVLWERPATDVDQPWDFRLTGAPGILTLVEAYEVSSEPGAAIAAGRKLFDLRHEPEASELEVAADMLLPERLILGIGRSDLIDGTEPTETGYVLEFVPATALPAAGDDEPNDDAATATRVDGAFAISGDVAGSDDHFGWMVPEEGPPDGWHLEARTVAGVPLRLTLRDGTGRSLASTTADERGVAELRDLRLPAGVIDVTLGGEPPDGQSPYALSARAEDGPGDPEPNDDRDLAAPLAVGAPLTGRLTSPTDIDLYRLARDDPTSQQLIDVRLIWRSGAPRELCVRALDGSSLQCRRGGEGLVLKDLFVPGDILLAVSGSPDLDDPYVLRVDSTTAPSPEWETEPNDLPETANEVPPDGIINGSGREEDSDVFATVASGEPQLWRVDVEGTGLDRVEWLRADGTAMGSAEVARDGTSARLLDLYLVPGQRQFVRVRARAGDYRLALEPIGPPDPNGEREPNDGLAFNESLPVGVTRTGRLATSTDADEYRFTLNATDHVVLRLEAASDGDLDVRLYDDAGLGITHLIGPGESRDLDLLLRSGDYRIVMVSRSPGEERYALRLDRADPFVVAQDQEPNDSPGWAGEIPATGRIVGSGRNEGDIDWFRLPVLDPPRAIAVVAGDGVDGIELLTDATTRAPFELDDDGVTYRSETLAAGVEHYLQVRASGDYAFSVEGLPAPPGSGAEAANRAPVLETTLPSAHVSAFWPSAQRVDGTLRLAGANAATGPWTVEARTSDDRWSVEVPTDGVRLASDGSAELAFAITVPRDVSADVPVRISFRARHLDGTQATTSIDVVPDRDALPLDPHRAWSVPEALLGGMDVASPWLGATLLPTVDPEGEAELHDGLAPIDGGLTGPIGDLPLELTVDLAGDEPVPVAGTILNALSGDPTFGDSPRRFELDLSLDGAGWTRVLSGILQRSIRDQPFVLDEPVDARFARLRILSTHRESENRIGLGEWKVVAVPGTAPGAEPIDLAEPALGGHVAWTEPQLSRIELTQAMIDEDPTSLEPAPAEPGTRLSWAIGFHEGRPARITEIGWSDPPGSDPTARFDELEVSVSRDGPLGPWAPLGTWALTRGADGSVAPLVPEQPVWARFVRFVTDPTPRDARWMELPSAIRILEVPTSDDYRSILGQWGLGERAGPFEASSSPSPGIADDPHDDTPARPRPIDLGAESSGRVHHEADADSYAIAVPRGHRSLRASVGGEPYVGVELVLRDRDGAEVPMASRPGERSGTMLYEASVEPGATYLLEVRQPASSLVVTFDTSASVGPYLDSILGSLRGLGADIVPGREVVRILPFDSEPLLPGWNDQAFEIQAAASSYVLTESSSGAEANLARSIRDLAPRRGARAVLIVTDAASSTYQATAELWRELRDVRPLVFAVQTGGINEAPSWQRHHLMSDWAASAGGVYRYAHSRADIEDAFDHLATWLRRPAGYRLTVTTSPDELPPPEPGRLTVTAPSDSTDKVVLAPDLAVEIILDTSGTMNDLTGGERRIDVAKRVLVDLIGQDLPSGIPVAVRTFGRGCASELLVPLQPLDAPATIATILDQKVGRRTPTPLAASIERAADDLAGATGPRILVVLTDGARDNCDGDPEAAVRSIADAGLDVRVNVVGFALGSRQDRRTMGRLAELGNGAYFDARRGDDLAAALAAAISAPFRVIDASGAVVAEGSVGGGPLEVETGTYVVEVDVEPEVRYDEVYIAPGATVGLTLPLAEEPAEAPVGDP